MNDHQMIPTGEELTERGHIRRETMRRELQVALARMHRARRRRRAAAGIAAPLALVAITIALWPHGESTRIESHTGMRLLASDRENIRHRGSENKGADQPSGTSAQCLMPGASASHIRIVQTDPDILARFVVLPSPPNAGAAATALVMDDETLVTALAQLDIHAGLIRSGGRAWLSTPVSIP